MCKATQSDLARISEFRSASSILTSPERVHLSTDRFEAVVTSGLFIIWKNKSNY